MRKRLTVTLLIGLLAWSSPVRAGDVKTYGEILTASNDERFLVELTDGTYLLAEAKTYCPAYDEGDNVVVVYNVAEGFLVKSGADECEFWTEDLR